MGDGKVIINYIIHYKQMIKATVGHLFVFFVNLIRRFNATPYDHVGDHLLVFSTVLPSRLL